MAEEHANRPDVALLGAAVPRSRPRTTPRYDYRTIASLHEEAAMLRGKRGSRFNVYGVVLNARAPCTSSGPDLRSEVILIDESCTGEAPDASKTLAVFRFDHDPACAVPHFMRGDIIRAHRLTLTRFDRKGQMFVQGNAQCYCTFLLWAADSDDQEPILSMKPTRGKHFAPPTEHSITDYDRQRVTELRTFSRNYFARLPPTITSAYIRRVRDVVNMPIDSPLLQGSFNLLAKYDFGDSDPFSDEKVRFRVRDGVNKKEDATIIVESFASDAHLGLSEWIPFDAFAASLRLFVKKKCDVQWMLIRDVRLHRSDETSERKCFLSVGKHSSTILWLPDYAPEVRNIFEEPVCEAHNATGSAAYPGPSEPIVPSPGAAPLASARHVPLEKYRIVGQHSGMHCPIASIRDVVEAARKDDRTVLRVCAKVSAWQMPLVLSRSTSRFCEACEEFVPSDTKCSFCGSEALIWTYRVKVTLADDDGNFIHCWIEGDHGTTFFDSTPIELNSGSEKAGVAMNELKSFVDKLLKDNVRLDCLVQPYAVSKFEVNLSACRIVRTKVLFDNETG